MMFWKAGCNCFLIIELMILSGKNEKNTRMKKAKQCLTALLSGALLAITVLSGCGQSQKAVSKNDDHLTVYLWENRLMKNIVPYIHEQFPDQDIEFITGTNDTALYSYFEEHGELPDIITVRRFSGKDAQDLEPYLMDFASYDVVSRYYSYALQYYKNSKNEIQWLPICGIPQTIIANKTLFEQYRRKKDGIWNVSDTVLIPSFVSVSELIYIISELVYSGFISQNYLLIIPRNASWIFVS